MSDSAKQYPKLLAFLQLFYPSLYKKLSDHSSKSDIVEASLISSNYADSFQAIVFSDGNSTDGELLPVYAEKTTMSMILNSWDWRWVFAIHILFKNEKIFTLSFKQKVIALPSGQNSLSKIFFKNLHDEFYEQTEKMLHESVTLKTSLINTYSNYI